MAILTVTILGFFIQGACQVGDHRIKVGMSWFGRVDAQIDIEHIAIFAKVINLTLQAIGIVQGAGFKEFNSNILIWQNDRPFYQKRPSKILAESFEYVTDLPAAV